MSPAPIHLERYIGPCLISTGIPHNHHLNHLQHNNNYLKKETTQNSRYRRYQHPQPTQQCHQQTNLDYCTNIGNGQNGNNNNNNNYQRSWSTTTTGLPLITMSPASPIRRNLNNNNNNNNNIRDVNNIKQEQERTPLSRLAIHTQGAPLIQSGRQQPRFIRQINKQPKKDKDVVKDFSSVISDESSNNSENSLPRIIKPRKRRKKDRKPPQNQQQQQQQNTTMAQTTPMTNLQQQQINNVIEDLKDTSIITLKPYTPLCQDFKPHNNGLQINPIIFNNEQRNNIIKEYKLKEDNIISAPCQCRYCDPINLTWDVEQRCYSPYLTPPSSSLSSNTSSLSSSPITNTINSTIKTIESIQLPQQSQQKQIIEDDNEQEWNRCSSLEISSEIITSPNGHRDIEIKFFTSTNISLNKNQTIIRPISVTQPWIN